MQEIEINKKIVKISYIEDVYADGAYCYISIYGESDEIIDVPTVDKIIEIAPNLVDKELLATRENASNLCNWLDD